MTKEQLRQMAQTGVLNVRFIKSDGTERTMKCTLLAEHLPPWIGAETISRAENPDVLAVWDLEAAGWRSFRIDSVQEAKTLLLE